MEVSFLMVGTPRSGTTLVQRLACELPGVSMSPETHFFSSGFALELSRKGGFPLHGTALDQALASYIRMYATGSRSTLPLDRTQVKALLGSTCERPADLFAAIVRSLAGPGAILGEKTPDHIRWWLPISRALPNVRFIFVVRDPRAVVESLIRMPWAGRSHVVLAERWRADQLCAISAIQTLGDRRCVTIRYEDFVRDPQAARETLAAFLGVDSQIAIGGDDESPASIVLPWESWKTLALSAVTTRRVEAWRETLPPKQGLDVAAICTSEMKRFGYVPPGSASWALLRRMTLGPRQWKRRLRTRRSTRKKQREIDAAEF